MVWLILLLLILVLLVLRQSLVLVLAVATAYIHTFVAKSQIEFLIQDFWFTVDREVLLSIPLFMLAGNIMSRGSIARRLIDFMSSLTSWLPGGLGIACVLSCAAFAAINGSSIVTMLAIGSIMYPALISKGYNKSFALGAIASAGASDDAASQAASRWLAEIVPALKPLVRAIYSVPKVLGVRDGALALGAPNDAHRTKCEQHRSEVEKIASGVIGAPVRVVVITDASVRHDDHDHDDHDPRDGAPSGSSGAAVVPLHPAGPPPADDEIDLHDLVDAPPASVVSPIDRLAQAFPGSELLDERL